MAEVVGTLASVLALLNSTISTFSLITKLTDVSATVHSLLAQTGSLEEILKLIQSDGVLDPDREPLKGILQSCWTDLSDLQKRLQTVARMLSGRPMMRRWGTVMGAMKEEEFMEAVGIIERHKSSLNHFFRDSESVCFFATPRINSGD